MSSIHNGTKIAIIAISTLQNRLYFALKTPIYSFLTFFVRCFYSSPILLC